MPAHNPARQEKSMDTPMTFNEAMFSQAQGWLLYWFYWLGYSIVLTPVILAFSRATRRDALIVALTNIAVVFSMGRLYDQIGYVRLLGIVHVILWTPLFVYLLRRAWRGEMGLGFRVVMWLFVVSLAISLAFDYVDVVRYLLGERESMV
jgi:hypothetical protein